MRINAGGNLEDVKFVRPSSAPEPCGSEAWPTLTSGPPGPPQSTDVNRTSNPDLLPLTHGIQTTLQLVHILCSDLCQTARTHKNHISLG